MKSNVSSFSDLSSLTTEQLKQLLHAQLDAEEPNVDLIKKVTAVLDAREPLPFDPDAGYRSLLQDHLDGDRLCTEDSDGKPAVRPCRPRVFRFARAASIAAIFLLVLLGGTAVAHALGFDLWGAVVRWSADTFGLSNKDIVGQTSDINTEDPYFVLRETIRNVGVLSPVVPYYLPEGYHNMETTREETYQGAAVNGIYKSEQGTILLTYVITQSDHPSRYYPIDDSDPEIYTVNGVDHFITSNEGKYRAFWTNENVVCDISGLEDEVVLKQMIDSIYEEELP